MFRVSESMKIRNFKCKIKFTEPQLNRCCYNRLSHLINIELRFDSFIKNKIKKIGANRADTEKLEICDPNLP